MSDIFQEVEEDLRRERAEKLWRKYGKYVIAFAALIVAVVAGWRGLEYYHAKQAEAAGAKFEDAIALARGGKTADAEAALAALSKDSPNGYQLLSRFRLAAEVAQRDAAEGVKAYQTLAADSGLGPLLRDLATVRAAMIEVDTKPYAEFRPGIEALAAPTSAWRHSVRELLGLSAYQAKDFAGATKWFIDLTSDPDVPDSLRQRGEVMLQMIRADAPPAGS